MVKVVHNKLLGGWYIVRGRHQTPIGGRFETKQAALDHLSMRAASTQGVSQCNK